MPLDWTSDRWHGIKRDYTPADVARLRGSVRDRSTPWPTSAPRRLWQLLKTEPFVPTLGALTGNQAMQQVKAGLKAIYLSGWQVAADANNAGQMYPDQCALPGRLGARRSSGASTTRCSAPTRSQTHGRQGRRRPTGSRRSSPTPRPASAARSTPSS